MKKDKNYRFKAVAILFLISLNGFAQSPSQKATLKPNYHFVKNVGQVTDQNGVSRPDVKFVYDNTGFKAILKENGFSYEFYRVDKQKGTIPLSLKSLSAGIKPAKATVYTHRVDVELLNSNH